MTFGRAIRRNLIAGLIVIAPVTITVFVLWWIFDRLDGLLGRALYSAIGTRVPGLGLLLLLLILIVVGWAAQRAVGKRIVDTWHMLLERFPLTRRLYGATNRIVRTVLGEEQRFFRDVVLVEYPGPGRWSIGFISTRGPEVMESVVDDPVTVFVPTVPNPATGYLVVVSRSEVRVLPWNLEQAFTFLLSVGGVVPETEGQSPTERGDR